MFCTLDQRIMLAVTATFKNGNLNITGTPEHDSAYLYPVKEQPKNGLLMGLFDFDPEYNGNESKKAVLRFYMSQLRTAHVDLGEGNNYFQCNTLWWNPSLTPFGLMTVLGGSGEDIVKIYNNDFRCYINGGDGYNELLGDGTIIGGAGRDLISSYDNSGPIYVDSGAGDDEVWFGARGTGLLSTLLTGEGNDEVHGSGTIDTGDGNDTVDCYGKEALIHLGKGNDVATTDFDEISSTIYGEQGNDKISAEYHAQKQSFYGGSGNDTLTGSIYDDYLDGGLGEDVINPKTGNDTVVASDSYRDLISQKEGNDTYILDRYDKIVQGFSVQLNKGVLRINGSLTDDYISVLSHSNSTLVNGEYVNTPVIQIFDTVLWSSRDSNYYGDGPMLYEVPVTRVKEIRIHAGSGDDNVTFYSDWPSLPANISITVNGGDGDDYIENIGAEGPTVLFGDAGNDSLNNASSMYGGDGNDRLYSYRDLADGGNGDDIFTNYSFAPTVRGGDGNDQIQITDYSYSFDNVARHGLVDAGGGDDSLELSLSSQLNTYDIQLGSGNDRIVYQDDHGTDTDLHYYTQATIHGGTGTDYINVEAFDHFGAVYGDEDNDTIIGSRTDDLIDGGSGDDSIEGRDGNDRLLGHGGRDYIDGGLGNDTLLGGAGIDALYGGYDFDRIYGNEGADSIYSSDGIRDTLFVDQTDTLFKDFFDLVKAG